MHGAMLVNTPVYRLCLHSVYVTDNMHIVWRPRHFKDWKEDYFTERSLNSVTINSVIIAVSYLNLKHSSIFFIS